MFIIDYSLKNIFLYPLYFLKYKNTKKTNTVTTLFFLFFRTNSLFFILHSSENCEGNFPFQTHLRLLKTSHTTFSSKILHMRKKQDKTPKNYSYWFRLICNQLPDKIKTCNRAWIEWCQCIASLIHLIGMGAAAQLPEWYNGRRTDRS